MDWIKTKDELPRNNILVETKIDDGIEIRNVARLRRQDSMWILPDGSMYVYYTPTHWRSIKQSLI